MKKRLTMIAMAGFLILGLQVQGQLVSKKGIPILPEAGEYMIGIDATPFFGYLGNMFNGNTFNSSPSFGFTANTPLSIYGKYMVDENTAYRGIFRLGFTNFTDKAYTVQDGQAAPIDPNLVVDDFHKNNRTNISLGAGLEKRRGQGRLQGIYGAQMIFSWYTDKDKYEYGNAYSTTNTIPTRNNYGTNNLGNAWVLSEKNGTIFGIAVQAFVGIEYFFAPKMSISGELYYGLSFLSQGEGSLEYENWDFTANAAKTTTSKTAGSNSFGFDTAVSGALNFNFYF